MHFIYIVLLNPHINTLKDILEPTLCKCEWKKHQRLGRLTQGHTGNQGFLGYHSSPPVSLAQTPHHPLTPQHIPYQALIPTDSMSKREHTFMSEDRIEWRLIMMMD